MEEYHLVNWIKDRKKSWTPLRNQLEAYIEAHPDKNDGVPEMLVDVREKLAKITKAWNAKRNGN